MGPPPVAATVMLFGTADLRLLSQALLLIGIPLAVWHIPFIRRLFPLVILQIIFGILIGPSLLGFFVPTFHAWVFDASSQLQLAGASFWGQLLFVFFSGLHIEREQFTGRQATFEFWLVAFASLLVPFALGCCVAILFVFRLFPGGALYGSNGSAVSYILAIGTSCGVTALPVLSAILLELNQLRSPLGRYMIAVATLHDVLLWILLTVVFALAGTHDGFVGVYSPLLTFVLVLVLAALVAFVLAPGSRWVSEREWYQKLPPVSRLSIVLFFMILTSFIGELIQVHSLVGAVLFGACLPKSEKHFVTEHVDVLNRALLLPLVFGSAGLKVLLGRSTSTTGYVFLGLIFAVVVGGFLGSMLPSRFLFGRSWRQSALIFSYAVSKGVVELVVASQLLARGIINVETFSAMVLMAIVCTVATKPVAILIGWGVPEDTLYYLAAGGHVHEAEPGQPGVGLEVTVGQLPPLPSPTTAEPGAESLAPH